MKQKWLFWITLALLIVCLAYIIAAPTIDDINQHHGLVGKLIILNRIRDLLVIPFCCGLCVFLICLKLGASCYGNAVILSKRLRLVCGMIALLMFLTAVYWSVGFIYMQVFPPMPVRVGYYLWEHKYLLCLWWVLDAVFLLFAVRKAA